MQRVRGPWTAQLLLRQRDDWWSVARGMGAGLALSALFGVALGARHGAAASLQGAWGVPAGFAVVSLFGAPAFYIGVAHAGVALHPRILAASLASSSALGGLVLASLAPAVALVSVSVDTMLGAAAVGTAGLAFGSALGLRHLFRDLSSRLGDSLQRWEPRVALRTFAVFGVLLSARVWYLTLPMLGRAAVEAP